MFVLNELLGNEGTHLFQNLEHKTSFPTLFDFRKQSSLKVLNFSEYTSKGEAY